MSEYLPIDQQEAKTRSPWVRVIFLTALLACVIEASLSVLGGIASQAESLPLHPKTLHTVWIVALVAVSFWLASKVGSPPGEFAPAAMLGLVIGGIAMLFMPDGWTRIDARYWGVESRLTSSSHEVGRYDEGSAYDCPLKLGYLHKPGCPVLKQDVAEEKALNEVVNTKGFLTWQSGVAQGYTACYECLPLRYDGFLGWLKLFLIVGPSLLVESMFMGMLRFFPVLLLAQVVFFVGKREFVWQCLRRD